MHTCPAVHSVHDDAPDPERVPGRHGLGGLFVAGHSKPAVQVVQVVEPGRLNWVPPQAVTTVDVQREPAGQRRHTEAPPCSAARKKEERVGKENTSKSKKERTRKQERPPSNSPKHRGWDWCEALGRRNPRDRTHRRLQKSRSQQCNRPGTLPCSRSRPGTHRTKWPRSPRWCQRHTPAGCWWDRPQSCQEC